jgi:hypothetical protein
MIFSYIIYYSKFIVFYLQIDPKVAFPRRAHPKVSDRRYRLFILFYLIDMH